MTASAMHRTSIMNTFVVKKCRSMFISVTRLFDVIYIVLRDLVLHRVRLSELVQGNTLLIPAADHRALLVVEYLL